MARELPRHRWMPHVASIPSMTRLSAAMERVRFSAGSSPRERIAASDGSSTYAV